MIRQTAIALLAISIGVSSAHAQRSPWTLDVGADVIQGRYAQGGANSVSFRRALGSLPQVPRVDIGLAWVKGSGTYSPFKCHLARQQYCFGGSERVTALELALSVEGEALGAFRGIAVSPVASFGAIRSRSEVRETEGPTTFCVSGGEIVSCPDNPPFQEFESDEEGTLPSYSLGVAARRPTGPVDLRLAVTAHRAGLTGQGHGWAGFSLGIGF